jgi:hypothetical protein
MASHQHAVTATVRCHGTAREPTIKKLYPHSNDVSRYISKSRDFLKNLRLPRPPNRLFIENRGENRYTKVMIGSLAPGEWLALESAAAYIDVSPDTIKRRRIPWQEEPVRHRIRFKLLELGDGTRSKRRYYRPDLEALLVGPPIHAGRPQKLDSQQPGYRTQYTNRRPHNYS